MDLNPYKNVLFIMLLFTCFSYIVEINNKTSINNLNKSNNIGLFTFRYIHYLLLFYFSCFLIFFNCENVDGIIFVIISIIMVFTWSFIECCIISYYELKFYNVNHHDYLTTFHPCLYVLFKDFQSYPLMASGIMMFLTFLYILFKNKILSLQSKLISGGVFLYLFFDNILKSRLYETKQNYPIDKNHILYRYFSFL